MKLLVLVTRMWPSPGTDDDEFVQLWAGEQWESVSPVLEQTVGQCRLFILHGCSMDGDVKRFRKSTEAEMADATWSQVETLAEDLPTHEVGVLFHPPANKLALKDALRQRIAVSRVVGKVAFVEDYEGRLVEDQNSALGQLAAEVKASVQNKHAPGPALGHAYEAVWRRYEGNQSLENALSVLHACLTPEGAGDVVEILKSGDIVLPADARHLPGLLYEIVEPFSEDYVGALRNLRNRLLNSISETGESAGCFEKEEASSPEADLA